LLNHQKDELKAKGLKIDYLNLFSFDKVAPVTDIKANQKYILAGAVYCGDTRLIDNMILEIQD
jgi:pantoate--beta-alanine ligase